MIPTNGAEFLIAARTIANAFCDRLARMAMPPEQVAGRGQHGFPCPRYGARDPERVVWPFALDMLQN